MRRWRCRYLWAPSFVIPNDYMGPTGARTSLGGERHALYIRPEALGANWPLANSAFAPSAAAPTKEAPKRANAMPLDAARITECHTETVEIASRTLGCASGAFLMSREGALITHHEPAPPPARNDLNRPMQIATRPLVVVFLHG